MILDEICDEVLAQAGTETASTTTCRSETYLWREAPGDFSPHGAICRNEPVSSCDPLGLNIDKDGVCSYRQGLGFGRVDPSTGLFTQNPRKDLFVYTKKGGWMDSEHIDRFASLYKKIHHEVKICKTVEKNMGSPLSELPRSGYVLSALGPYAFSYETPITFLRKTFRETLRLSVPGAILRRYTAEQITRSLMYCIITEDEGFQSRIAGGFIINPKTGHSVEDLPSDWIAVVVGERMALRGLTQQSALDEVMQELCPVEDTEAIGIINSVGIDKINAVKTMPDPSKLESMPIRPWIQDKGQAPSRLFEFGGVSSEDLRKIKQETY